MKRDLAEHFELTSREKKDLKVLALFTWVYCRDHHRDQIVEKNDPTGASFQIPKRFRYCPECWSFLNYAISRRLQCPLEDKPTCKHCHIHCYRPGHRDRVREIMRYSGKKLLKRGRLDLLVHFLF